MKKVISLLLCGVMLLSLCACLKAPKLEGSFTDMNDDRRYSFTLGEKSSGDYGGSCEYYEKGKLLRTDAWYAEDGKVFINGVHMFNIDGDCLAEVSSKCTDVTVSGAVVTGTVPSTTVSGLEFKTAILYNPDITFKDDGTCEASGQVLLMAKKTVQGTYSVEGKLIKIAFEEEKFNHTAYVFDGDMYYDVFIKS